MTSTWTCESPATICSPVCWSRCRSIVGSSSCRRRSAAEHLSSSPLVFGSIAKAMTGAGGEPVAGAGLLQLGHGADVAGAELVDGLGLLAAEADELPDALLAVGAG